MDGWQRQKQKQTSRRIPGWAAWITAVLAIAFLARTAFAQEAEVVKPFDLVGTVSDPAGQPLVGAFVHVPDSDWGSLTDRNGAFRLPKTTPGSLILAVELLGYEPLAWEGTVHPGTALSLQMAPQPVVLEGLTVVTDRLASRRRGAPTAVRWFDHAALATSPQRSTLDFMAARGLFVVGCKSTWSSLCAVVRGRVAQPTVWVDEAPVIAGLDYLDAMPPQELYMVEMYGGGRHIRAYTNRYMERVAKEPLWPVPFTY